MTAAQIVVVDYGMGNVLSVRRSIERCGGSAVLSSDADQVSRAERLVLPGVGAFGDCMAALGERGLIEPIKAFVATGRPFLGICVGMQILLDWGEEFGGAAGLGLIPGRVAQIPTAVAGGGDTVGTRKIPHIGWTGLAPRAGADGGSWKGTLLEGTEPGTPFYFVHSFSAAPVDPAHILAVADYQGFPVTAAVVRDNITGTQFHPEKSGQMGLALIERFLADVG